MIKYILLAIFIIGINTNINGQSFNEPVLELLKEINARDAAEDERMARNARSRREAADRRLHNDFENSIDRQRQILFALNDLQSELLNKLIEYPINTAEYHFNYIEHTTHSGSLEHRINKTNEAIELLAEHILELRRKMQLISYGNRLAEQMTSEAFLIYRRDYDIQDYDSYDDLKSAKYEFLNSLFPSLPDDREDSKFIHFGFDEYLYDHSNYMQSLEIERNKLMQEERRNLDN